MTDPLVNLGFRSSAAWAWGRLTLHLAEAPSLEGPWLVAVGGSEVFAIRAPLDRSAGVAYRWGTDQLIHDCVSTSPTDRYLIPDGPAVLTLAHEHFKGSTHSALMVLTPDGIIRAIVAGTLDLQRPPHVLGTDLILTRTPDHWRKDEDDVVRVSLTGDPGADVS